jgi:phosphopantetheine adenylyltransferase
MAASFPVTVKLSNGDAKTTSALRKPIDFVSEDEFARNTKHLSGDEVSSIFLLSITKLSGLLQVFCKSISVSFSYLIVIVKACSRAN